MTYFDGLCRLRKLRYSQENLRNALQEIDRGMPTATASKQLGIPRTTLLYKKTGKYPRECRKGPSTNLCAFEEDSSTEIVLESEEELYCEISERPNPVERSLLTVGIHVIVLYELDYFPGIIREINNRGAYVSVMQKSLANTWKWPTKEDSLWYEFSDILEIIEEPVKANERGAFREPEFLKYADFTFN